MRDRAVVVMGKLPLPGRVKTRIAKRTNPALAASLYRAMLEDVFALVAPIEAEKVFACALERDDELDVARALAPPEWRVIPQRGYDLGERIEAARADAGAARVVVLGSDSPGLPPARIREALDAESVAIGPTVDGGYYLIAMSEAVPQILSGIPWSTDQVMTVTRSRARTAGIELVELAPFYDIDEVEDLPRALADSPPRTLAAAQDLIAWLQATD